MISTLIAVATRKDGTIDSHAGRAQFWQVFVVTEEKPFPVHAWDIQLTDVGCLHEWHVRPDNGRHPLHYVHVAIASSAGEGVRRRLDERGTMLVDTAETDPLQAVKDYVAGCLKPGKGHDEADCLDPENHHARSQTME